LLTPICCGVPTILTIRGADSDRGSIYVRYGPPDIEFGSANHEPSLLGNLGMITIGQTWRYNNGLSFYFEGQPMFGNYYLTADEKPLVDALVQTTPVRWDNVPAGQNIEQMGVRTTAFRGPADSLEIVVAAMIPTANLVKGIELGGIMPFNLSSSIIDAHIVTQAAKSSVARFKRRLSSIRPSAIIHTTHWARRQCCAHRCAAHGHTTCRTRNVERHQRPAHGLRHERSPGSHQPDAVIGQQRLDGVMCASCRQTGCFAKENDRIGMGKL